MKAITTPLITTVDATAATAALSKPQSRIDIIDFNISSDIKKMVQNRKNVYHKARIEREHLEYELDKKLRNSQSIDFKTMGNIFSHDCLCYHLGKRGDEVYQMGNL